MTSEPGRAGRRNPRLFVALPLPDHIRAGLLKLNAAFPELKFSGDLHLTLTFIGDVPEPERRADALRRVRERAFELGVTGLGFFPRGILWAGLKPNPELTALKRAVDIALATTGYIPEKREYRPHITLCRTKRPPTREALVRAENIKMSLTWKTREFRLFESILAPAGAIHKAIETYPLAD
ncbi:MAG: RNA 2',3'-cyclic phosphodiesterase [Desulfovibrio sp.]|nr:RNA 2',3'-cyclic phosphodiesterase [Desulfovibrio sp.]